MEFLTHVIQKRIAGTYPLSTKKQTNLKYLRKTLEFMYNQMEYNIVVL